MHQNALNHCTEIAFLRAPRFSNGLSSITEDIKFNIRLNGTAIVLITAGHTVFISKIAQTSIDFLSHILFGREHKWGQCNAGSFLQNPSVTTPPPPTITIHPTKNSPAKLPNGSVNEGGGARVTGALPHTETQGRHWGPTRHRDPEPCVPYCFGGQGILDNPGLGGVSPHPGPGVQVVPTAFITLATPHVGILDHSILWRYAAIWQKGPTGADLAGNPTLGCCCGAPPPTLLRMAEDLYVQALRPFAKRVLYGNVHDALVGYPSVMLSLLPPPAPGGAAHARLPPTPQGPGDLSDRKRVARAFDRAALAQQVLRQLNAVHWERVAVCFGKGADPEPVDAHNAIVAHPRHDPPGRGLDVVRHVAQTLGAAAAALAPAPPPAPPPPPLPLPLPLPPASSLRDVGVYGLPSDGYHGPGPGVPPPPRPDPDYAPAPRSPSQWVDLELEFISPGPDPGPDDRARRRAGPAVPGARDPGPSPPGPRPPASWPPPGPSWRDYPPDLEPAGPPRYVPEPGPPASPRLDHPHRRRRRRLTYDAEPTAYDPPRARHDAGYPGPGARVEPPDTLASGMVFLEGFAVPPPEHGLYNSWDGQYSAWAPEGLHAAAYAPQPLAPKAHRSPLRWTGHGLDYGHGEPAYGAYAPTPALSDRNGFY